VKVRIALATEKYNPSVIRRSDVDKDESQGQRPKRTGYDINKESTGACISGNTTHHSDFLTLGALHARQLTNWQTPSVICRLNRKTN
jgi:hypothetical protein